MLAADDIAGKAAIIQDEWAPYTYAPHCILAQPLLSPCAVDGSYTPGNTHPRTPLFRAGTGLSPAAIQRGKKRTSWTRALYHAL
jgi:hypothetical protein